MDGIHLILWMAMLLFLVYLIMMMTVVLDAKTVYRVLVGSVVSKVWRP